MAIKIRESYVGFKLNFEVVVLDEYGDGFIYSRSDTLEEAEKFKKEYISGNKKPTCT